MINNPHSIPALNDAAVVLLSGGQDSTTCLAWAKHMFERVEAVSFNYGQRHIVELDVAEQIAKAFGVNHRVLDVPALQQIGAAGLTNSNIDNRMDATGTGNTYAEEHNLPSSFVPGRNAILLATAIAYAAPMGIYNLVTGVCEADDAGYPDCREDFVGLLELALQSALDDDRVEICAPLLTLNKAKTFQMAADLNALEEVLELSHTCYEGDHTKFHEWGYGCGECPACQTRAKGWHDFQATQVA